MTPTSHPLLPISVRGLILASVVLGGVVLACSPSSEASSGESGGKSVAVEIRDLVAALTPLPQTALPVQKTDWHRTRKQTLERLRRATVAHGREALRVYREEAPDLPEIRAGLLDVAAHTATEETTPVLVELVTTFGEDLLVRTLATEYLGECAPERAVEVIEPVLRERYDDRTYPPEERLLAAWVVACGKLSLDPVPLLAEIATDLNRSPEVRHLATRTLGEHDSPRSRQALRVLLVESTGNGYIRRIALQSLREILPKEEFCELVTTVQGREADPEFLRFLESARNANCP